MTTNPTNPSRRSRHPVPSKRRRRQAIGWATLALILALVALAVAVSARPERTLPPTSQAEPPVHILSLDELPERDPWTRYPVPLDGPFQRYVNDLCAENDVDPALVYAIMAAESGFDPTLTGDGGKSIGLMQIYVNQHQDRMARLGVTDPADPYQNVAVGIDLLADLQAYELGDVWTLHAYNGGLSYAYLMEQAGTTSGYASSVLRTAEELTEGIQIITGGDTP